MVVDGEDTDATVIAVVTCRLFNNPAPDFLWESTP